MEPARQIAPKIKNPRGVLGALRKRKDQLNTRDRERLVKFFAKYPALAPLDEKMPALRSPMSPENQTKRACRPLAAALLELISELRQSAFAPLLTPAETLQAWSEPLAALGRFTKNNGITEGFHRKIKLVQRWASLCAYLCIRTFGRFANGRTLRVFGIFVGGWESPRTGGSLHAHHGPDRTAPSSRTMADTPPPWETTLNSSRTPKLKSIVLCGRLWLKGVATPKATSTHAQNNAFKVSPDFRFQPSSIP